MSPTPKKSKSASESDATPKKRKSGKKSASESDATPKREPQYEEHADGFIKDTLIAKGGERIGFLKSVYWNGKVFIHNGQKYEAMSDTGFCLLFRKWLARRKYRQTNRLVGNVIPIVHQRIHLSESQYPAMPFYYGEEAFPEPRNIIAFENGLLDSEAYIAGKRTLRPHTPEWVSTVCLPYKFDLKADCPVLKRCLSEYFGDDKEQVSLWQEWCGYCMTLDTSQQKFLLMVGVPSSGKSTLCSILKSLVGKENTTGFTASQLADRFGLFDFVGKLVAFCGEVELRGSSRNGEILEKLKSITGEDMLSITARDWYCVNW
jgi:hypothetical protein